MKSCNMVKHIFVTQTTDEFHVSILRTIKLVPSVTTGNCAHDFKNDHLLFILVLINFILLYFLLLLPYYMCLKFVCKRAL